MSFCYPVSRYLKITQIYHSGHLGIDFGWHDMKPSYMNQPIVAIEDGEVVMFADGFGNTYPNRKIYGNYVIVSHGSINGDKWWSVYAHLKKNSITVRLGQKVSKGQILGLENNSGYSNGEHLHFELRKGVNDKAHSIDPMDYLFVEDPSIYVNPDSKWISRIRYKETTIGSPVQRMTSKEQVEVITDTLRAREKIGLKGEILGYVTKGIYNVLEEKNADGYTWAKVEHDLWFAENESSGWTIRYHAEAPKLWSVTFPKVSNGDKQALLDLADKLKLDVEVTEREGV